MKKRSVLYSLVSSLILIFISYFYNNFPLFTGESMFQYYWIQKVCESIGIHKSVNYGDAVFYNMSYDKMLIPAIDKKSETDIDTLGDYSVTDRLKILTLLQQLEKTDKYKYVILDVVFDKKEPSKYDDALFSQISKMRNVVVANHTELNFASPELEKLGKTGLVTFYTTKVSTNFGRIEYTINDKRSLPLVVYENINSGVRMKRYGIGRLSFYTIGGKICQNSSFLTFDDYFVKKNQSETKNNYYISSEKYINYGKFISNPHLDENLLLKMISRNTNKKYVVIGDFYSDVHDTYVGAIPGPIIMMRGLANLEEGGNIVRLSHVLLWFFVFFIINISILYNRPISRSVPIIKNITYKWFHFIFSLFSFGVFLFICSIFEYICGYPIYSLVIIIIYFSLLKVFIQYKNSK